MPGTITLYASICNIIYYCSSFFAEERRARKKRRRPELKGTHTSFFNYSMNSLRSYSISYLVAQPKVETRYNQKNLHAFQPFRAECRHACRLEFLADSIPYYMMVDIICAYLRNCASAPNFLKRRKALA